ncbi:MAG: DUF3267 domain-containing protein [Balneolaceae bacterium]
MKPTREELLNDDAYRKVEELIHDEIADFVMKNLQDQNLFTLTFKFFSLAFAATMGAQLYLQWNGWETVVGILIGALTLFTAGILVHELLHLLAYAVQGARKLSIVPKWKQGAVVAAADGFVLGRKGFYLLAMTPFAVLTTAGVAGLLITDGWLFFAILSFLMFHTFACIGDFTMAGFFYRNRHRQLYTFDDMEEGKSYFFEKEEVPAA